MLGNSEVIGKLSQPFDNHKNENKAHTKKIYQYTRNVYGKSLYLEKRDDKRLRQAASTNDVERLNNLLGAGVNPNTADENGRTALHVACAKGYSDIVKTLLDHHADCNMVDKLGNTPLHLAVCTTSSVTVNMLLKAGCSVSSRGNNGCTPLQLAQSKLWLLQRHTSQDYNTLKSQVSEVIDMMKRLVEKESEEAQLVESFSSRLSLTQTKDQVAGDVKTLLDNLDSLHINKPFIKPSRLMSPTGPVLKQSLEQLHSLTMHTNSS